MPEKNQEDYTPEVDIESDALTISPETHDRTGPISFLKQSANELQKTVWPSRKELLSYTLQTLFFILVVGLIIASFDFLVGKSLLWFFG